MKHAVMEKIIVTDLSPSASHIQMQMYFKIIYKESQLSLR